MTSATPTPVVARYLERLTVALASAPADLRADIVSGISEELEALTPAEADLRVAELGDPARIAADAMAGLPAPLSPQRRSAYLIVTVVLLVIGGYILAVLGWIAALVMIGVDDAWTTREKRTAIGTSVAGALVGLAALLAFRGSEQAITGLVAFWLVPLACNVVVAYYVANRWTAHTGRAITT